MPPEAPIAIEVVYARAGAQEVVALRVEQGTSVREAIRLSGLPARFADVENAKVGIFGRLVALETLVRDGDRVELYRPLVADPRHTRRRRASRTT